MEPAKDISGISFLEKIVLLALDNKGWFGNSENSIKFGLAGAIIYELVKKQRIEIREGVIVVKDKTVLNDELLDKVMDFINNGKKNRSIRTWIQRLVYKKITIRKSLLRSLISKEIIRKEEYSIMWIVYQFKYPLVNPLMKEAVQEAIYNQIMRHHKPGGHDLMMIAVMDSCRMLRKNFRNMPDYQALRRRVRHMVLFNDPALEDYVLIANIHNSIRRAIASSNVSLHV